MKWSLVLQFLALGANATPLTGGALSCQDIEIPVSVSAQNKNLPLTLGLDTLKDTGALNRLVAGLTSSLVHGTYTIHARYCEPTEQVASRRDTLQVLVHGITYTLDYWSGDLPPGTSAGQDEYSWIKYAANQGYPTLSIDRLCNGASSRPNGLVFCQLPLQAEVIHAIVEAARNGTLPEAKQSFDKIICVGHSYGSLVANGHSTQYPDDVDAYIFTGYSDVLTQGEAGVAVLSLFLPAAVVSPTEFGGLLLDPTYLLSSSKNGTKSVEFYGDYDAEFVQYDLDHRGTVTLGEVATGTLGQIPAPHFKGAVFVLNGNEDGIFCEDGPVQALATVPGNCSKGYSSGVASHYPAASKFGYYNTANTGHCLNIHLTAQESFKHAHNFLSEAGF